jgi:hypothetical protein
MRLALARGVRVVALLVPLLAGGAPLPRIQDRACGAGAPAGAVSDMQFRALLDTVARGWNGGDADLSASCFAEAAVYLEPPDRQLYRGRTALRQFFADSIQPARPDRMRWHVIAFDASRQIGIAEYTYRGRRNYHGAAVVRLDGGLIGSWREYQYGSELSWEDFAGPSR